MLPIKFFDVQGKVAETAPDGTRERATLLKGTTLPQNLMAMVPKNMVRVQDFFLVNSSKTSCTLTILFGNVAIKFGAALLSLSAT